MEERRRLLTATQVDTEGISPKSSWDWSCLFLNCIETIGRLVSIVRFDREDDAASIGVKQFITVSVLSILLWHCSFVIIMIEVILFDKFTANDWLMFLPMWTGSILGISGSVSVFWRLYSKAKLISKDRRLYMIAQGIMENESYVDYESLPLMRSLFVWSIAGSLSFLSALIGQMLYFWWFNRVISNIFDVYIPIGVTCFFFMIYMFAMNIFSYRACLLFFLLVVQVVVFGAKIGGQHNDIPWLLVTVPLYVASSMLLFEFAQLWYKFTVSKSISLASHQSLALTLYSFGILFMDGASIYTSIFDWTVQQSNVWNPDVVYIVWTIAITMIITASILVWRHEGMQMANHRGYRDPLVLSHTANGWEPTPNMNSTWTWSLGEIMPYEAAPKQQVSQPATSSISTSSISTSSVSTTKKYGSELELSRV